MLAQQPQHIGFSIEQPSGHFQKSSFAAAGLKLLHHASLLLGNVICQVRLPKATAPRLVKILYRPASRVPSMSRVIGVMY
jgi:hypothetical protein